MDPSRRTVIWARIGCAVISAAALCLLFQRLKFNALLETLRTMRPGWFAAAILANGLAFVPATWRWHLVLRLTGNAVHPSATARLTLIGHFFYLILFGAAGGDTAKAALYARWFRLPFASILATAPLDRFLGFAGLVCFTTSALLLASVTGAFKAIGSIAFNWHKSWWVVVLLVIVAMLWLAKRSRSESGWGKFANALVQGASRLFCAPRIAIQGLLCGLLVQVALSAVLAFNLQAVSHGPIPWSHVIWTLPVISILSALPVTIAGIGTREGAALLLLGFYGVSEANAVAASLLTLSCNLVWAIAAALLLWFEGNLRRRSAVVPKTITAIIPTLNEAELLPETLRQTFAIKEIIEVIVVDGGSEDQTRQIAAGSGCRVLDSAPSRGGQMRLGAAQAKGDVILLLHADTWLPAGAGSALLNCLRDGTVVGGGFWKVFRDPSPLLLGSRFRCAVRLYLGRRIAGDQGLFVRRETLEKIGGVPDMPLMEEFELCRRLRKCGRLALADATVETSARRFSKLGIVRTYLRMWGVLCRYYLGTAPQDLRRLYEKD